MSGSAFPAYAAATYTYAPMKSIFEWAPSQNGFLVEAPHRHSEYPPGLGGWTRLPW